ncbi:hypothetical protein AAVH_27665 [Aphelenchoides avenae]|nr:hypothetical protein AAVH_27665 [Aphelenchus avenae]
MLKVGAVLLLCAYALHSTDAREPFTKTRSLLCRIKCPETWFHDYDTWMTSSWLSWVIQVDRDMRECKRVNFQPWVEIAGVVLIAIAIILSVRTVVVVNWRFFKAVMNALRQ